MLFMMSGTSVNIIHGNVAKLQKIFSEALLYIPGEVLYFFSEFR